MNTVDLQGFSYQERFGLLPHLTTAFTACGGWITDRKTVSPDATVFHLEIRLSDVLDLYAAILSAGLELTRPGHLALTALCTCYHHLAFTGELAQTLTIRLEINFLEDVTLHSLLMSGAASA